MKEPKDPTRKLPRPPRGGKAAGRFHQAEEAFGLDEATEQQPKTVKPSHGQGKKGDDQQGDAKKP